MIGWRTPPIPQPGSGPGLRAHLLALPGTTNERGGDPSYAAVRVPKPSTVHTLTLDYTNHRGERALRCVTVFQLYYGTTEFHKEPQWLLEALDVSRRDMRTFAVRDIHFWVPDWWARTGPYAHPDLVLP